MFYKNNKINIYHYFKKKLTEKKNVNSDIK